MNTKFCLIGVLIIASCNMEQKGNTAENEKKEVQSVVQSPEKFNDFYVKFYADSVFQISRVVFPLPGDNSDGYNPEEPEKEYFWKKEEWLLLQTPPVNDTIYKKTLDVKDSVAMEEIIIPDSGFRIKRKFQLKEGQWFLTNYIHLDM